MNDAAQFVPIALLLVMLYLLVLRPARKRARDVAALQAALSPGDEVLLTSGIYATVDAIEDDRVRVSVADGVVLTVHRGAVGQIVQDVPASAPELDEDGATTPPPRGEA